MYTKTYSFLFCLIFLSLTWSNSPLKASIKTSIANGSWHSATTWNPVGVPIMEDTVLIASHVTLNQEAEVGFTLLWIGAGDSLTGDSALILHGDLLVDGRIRLGTLAVGDGDGTVNNGHIQAIDYVTGNDFYRNNGTIESVALYSGESMFYQDGQIVADWVAMSDSCYNTGRIQTSDRFFPAVTFWNEVSGEVYARHCITPGMLTNKGFMSITDSLLFSAGFNNTATGIVTTDILISLDFFTNDGEISANNWSHAYGTVSGSGGKFCIADCFQNTGTITGNVDVCDATPNSICDLQAGSITATVTLCSSGPCSGVVGVVDATPMPAPEMLISPNPAVSSANLDLRGFDLGPVNIQVFRADGALVYQSEMMSEARCVLNVSTWSEGIYVCVVQQGVQKTSRKLIVFH